MASKYKFRVERKKFETLEGARAYAEHIFYRTGAIVAIEALPRPR